MAKRNKKGGWTGTAAGANAVKSGGGPQVEKQFGELKKYDTKSTPFQKMIRAILFILVCVLAGSLIYQATPKNMAEYWELDAQKDAISSVEITVYPEGEKHETAVLTSVADIEAFYTVLDETNLKRLWFADKEGAAFTSDIRVYVNGESEPSYEVGFAENRVFFLNMPTYDWYLAEGAPLLDYLK